MMTISTAQFPALFYRKFGEGPAVVLLHGFPESGVLWQDVWPALSQHFTVIVPDLPGSGQSSRGNDKVSMESMAAGINAIFEAENIDRAVLSGHSMGGYVAQAFAELYSHKVAGLSMVHSSALADDNEKKATRKKVIDLIRKGGKDTFIKQMVPALFSPQTHIDRPGIIEKQVESGLKLDAESMIAYYEAMLERPERRQMLQTSALPAQWIIGRDDNTIPFTIGLQQCTLALVNFVSVYNKCGHMSMLENRDHLVNDLVDFADYCNNR